MKKVCVVTSTRADYGILKPLIECLYNTSDIEVSIVATGMHLCPEFGDTFREIEADGYAITKKIDIQLSSDSPAAMSKSMGMAMICFSDYFQGHTPDLLVILGDRYEIAAVCCAAVNQRIPIAHLYGGETTQGAVDECYRHSITKMSSLHFTSCKPYRKRVIQLGEQPERVFNVGALSVENITRSPLMALTEVSESIGSPLEEKRYSVVTFHPVTMESGTGAVQLKELMAALDMFPDMRFIITKANSDAGGREINRLWDEYARARDNCYLTESLGMKRYLSALKHSAMMIGNSSSGTSEGPVLKIPTVNIGDRQKGRIMADSVLNCPPNAKDIEMTIRKALTPEFRAIASECENPYGNGEASRNITERIMEFLYGNVSFKKEFYDIIFEV